MDKRKRVLLGNTLLIMMLFATVIYVAFSFGNSLSNFTYLNDLLKNGNILELSLVVIHGISYLLIAIGYILNISALIFKKWLYISLIIYFKAIILLAYTNSYLFDSITL